MGSRFGKAAGCEPSSTRATRTARRTRFQLPRKGDGAGTRTSLISLQSEHPHRASPGSGPSPLPACPAGALRHRHRSVIPRGNITRGRLGHRRPLVFNTTQGRPRGSPLREPFERPAVTAALRATLLDLDGAAGLFDVGLELLGLVLVDALLDGLGGLVDERLGLLQAQAGRRADDLDDLDLLVARAGEDDVERRLLLLGLGRVAAAAAGGPATATALAETPKASSRALMRSESSRTEIDLSSSIQSSVVVAMFLGLRGGLSGSGFGGLGGGSRVGRGGGAADQALVGDRLQLAGEAGGQVVQRGREAAERRSDQADEAADEDVAARELGDRVDVFRRQRRRRSSSRP